MSTQASGYFTVSGTIGNQTVSVVINGVTYSQNITSSESYATIAQNYSNYLNTQTSFTQYFNSTYSGNSFYINVNPGNIYDGNPGNHVTISSSFSSNLIYVSATGSVNTFATQNPQYGNSTLTVGPFSTSIFVDAYSDQSAAIAAQLNANPTFSANFIASSSQNFVVHFTTQNTGAYPGVLGNGLALSITPYGSASGSSLSGGSTTQSITLIPNNATLTGGQSSNVEKIDNFIVDGAISNVMTPQLPPNPLVNLNIEVLNNDIIEFLRTDLYMYLVQENICSPQLPQIIIEGTTLAAFTGDDGIPNFKNGFYYRMPISNTMVNGSLAPKYYAQLSSPYVSFPYPVGNVNNSLMLVKTIEKFAGNLPGDVTQITQQQARTDLLNIFNTIFAL